MVNPLLILCMRRLGTNPQRAESLALTWQHTIHHIKTKYGISTTSYQNTDNELLYGLGQGSTLGPFSWLLCFILIVNSIKNTTPRLHHRSVDNSIELHHLGDSFVDDTALGCSGLSPNDPLLSFSEQEALRHSSAVSNLATLSQEWEKLLFSTGGGINLTKSFWFLMSWTWKDGIATLLDYEREPTEIPCIEPTSTYWTLGAYISPSGSTT
jgi:hypothetical protein